MGPLSFCLGSDLRLFNFTPISLCPDLLEPEDGLVGGDSRPIFDSCDVLPVLEASGEVNAFRGPGFAATGASLGEDPAPDFTLAPLARPELRFLKGKTWNASKLTAASEKFSKYLMVNKKLVFLLPKFLF